MTETKDEAASPPDQAETPDNQPETPADTSAATSSSPEDIAGAELATETAATSSSQDAISIAPASADAAPTVPPPRPPTPPPTLRQRLWPEHPAARIAFVISALLVAAYVVAVMFVRYAGIFAPLSADGDQYQAVFHYWRYAADGAFPPGDLFTDYAFAVHAPPFWWALMAAGSTLFTPLVTAKALNIIALVLGLVMMWIVVARRSNAFIGLVAVVLMIRNWDYTYIIAGGYARSFGPFLTLLFLDAFLAGAHRRALIVLVVQAGLYPSVVIPCGLAYGLYCVLRGPMPDRLRRCAGMFVAGLLIIGLGKSQDLQAKEWWGHIVNLEEATAMPSWGRGGRNSELPLIPVGRSVDKYFSRAFRQTGEHYSTDAANWVGSHLEVVAATMAFGIALSFVLVMWRRRRGGQHLDTFPWQVPYLALAAFAAFIAARIVFFKLYMPYRPLQHVWPYMVFAASPLIAWAIFSNVIRNRVVATTVSAVLVLVPTFAALGDGLAVGYATYRSSAVDAELFEWMKTQPTTAVFAGEITFSDRAPLFSQRMTYARKNLTHPFREPLYNECERRLRENYTALYATKFSDVIRFARAEKVDFFIVRDASFEFDTSLFQPLIRQLRPVFAKGRAQGFALKQAPASAIVYRNSRARVISVDKLEAALAAGEMADLAVPPPPKAAKPASKARAPLPPSLDLKARKLPAVDVDVDGDEPADDSPGKDDVSSRDDADD